MNRLLRLLRILSVALRHGLYEFIPTGRVRSLLSLASGHHSTSRAVRLRGALEELGPIFVKFGQVLSTRRDLLPQDLADELARLQDNVQIGRASCRERV